MALTSFLRRNSGNASFLIFAITLLVISAVCNIYLYNSVSSISAQKNAALKKAAEASTPKVNTAELEKLSAENARLNDQALQLEAKIKELSDQNRQLNEDILALSADRETLEKYAGLEARIKGYADQAKQLAEKQFEYYDYYKKSKENIDSLTAKIKELQAQQSALDKKAYSSADATKEVEAKYIYELAFLSVEAALFDKAVDYFSRLAILKPDDPNVHYNLAVIYEQGKENNRKAIEHYKRYLELAPNSGDAAMINDKIEMLSIGSGENVNIDPAAYPSRK